MSRLRWTRLLSLALVSVMPLGALAPGCTSGNTSTIGQRISCKDTGAGITDCHPAGSGSAGSGSDSCEDVDDDGDGMPHDDGEAAHDGIQGGTTTGTAATAGTTGSADDDDDDGDGIPNARDCDKRHGGDDDDRDGDDDDH